MFEEASGLPAELAGRFTLVRPLARGGFGVVLLVRQLGLDRSAVLKVLADTSNPEMLERFDREARVTAAISDPHVVRIFDHGIAGRTPWICYEFVEGDSLREHLERARPVMDTAVGWARDVGQALAVAHAAGVVHRDVKPENVMITAEGTAKLLDFGIARMTEGGAIQTASGVILGTPAYIAPEVVRGDAAGPASDLYALGVMLHEMVAGALPFTERSVADYLVAHVSKTPPHLRAVAPDAPPELAQLVSCLLDKSPDRRPSCAAATVARLDEVVVALGRGPVAPRSAGQATRAVSRNEAARTAWVSRAPAARTKSASARPDHATPGPAPEAPRTAGGRSIVRRGASVAAALVLVGLSWAWGTSAPDTAIDRTAPSAPSGASPSPPVPRGSRSPTPPGPTAVELLATMEILVRDIDRQVREIRLPGRVADSQTLVSAASPERLVDLLQKLEDCFGSVSVADLPDETRSTRWPRLAMQLAELIPSLVNCRQWVPRQLGLEVALARLWTTCERRAASSPDDFLAQLVRWRATPYAPQPGPAKRPVDEHLRFARAFAPVRSIIRSVLTRPGRPTENELRASLHALRQALDIHREVMRDLQMDPRNRETDQHAHPRGQPPSGEREEFLDSAELTCQALKRWAQECRVNPVIARDFQCGLDATRALRKLLGFPSQDTRWKEVRRSCEELASSLEPFRTLPAIGELEKQQSAEIQRTLQEIDGRLAKRQHHSVVPR